MRCIEKNVRGANHQEPCRRDWVRHLGLARHFQMPSSDWERSIIACWLIGRRSCYATDRDRIATSRRDGDASTSSEQAANGLSAPGISAHEHERSFWGVVCSHWQSTSRAWPWSWMDACQDACVSKKKSNRLTVGNDQTSQ